LSVTVTGYKGDSGKKPQRRLCWTDCIPSSHRVCGDSNPTAGIPSGFQIKGHLRHERPLNAV